LSIEEINAVTLSVADMTRSFAFYTKLGFEPEYGGPDAAFTSFRAGHQFLNLDLAPGYEPAPGWGRTIFHVSDVDAIYRRAIDAGLTPEMPPSDASWGERYFHILDPDRHELSFAKRL
jgi:catechol 2,3-dioxygenase-like lactoylglutathione lyase family enzyme